MLQEKVEKDFLKAFDEACLSQGRYSVWDDFVHMSALAIVNSVDHVHAEEREKQFERIKSKYPEEKYKKLEELFGITVAALEENPFQDFLGRIYMMCNLGNDRTGQFFTPYHVSKMCARMTVGDNEEKILSEIANKGYVALMDPSIGGGAMMIAGAQALYEIGINYQQKAVFGCQDIDSTTAMMAYIQLSLIGCPGFVVVGDSLRAPMTGHPLFGETGERAFHTPMFYSEPMNELRRLEIIRGHLTQKEEHESVKEEPKYIELNKKKGKAVKGQLMMDF